jgi:hypothetical protein
MVDEKRKETRDPGEQEQNKAVSLGLTDAPEVIEGADAKPAKCPTCGRDHVNS